MAGSDAVARVRGYARRNWAALALIAGIFVLCVISQRPGHDWGDDFALYLNQARALVEGDVGGVLAANRYTLQESTGSTFSPLSYPWGAPLLFAPVVAVWGVNFQVLKVLVSLFFAGFLLMLYVMVARRAGRAGGLAVLALIGLSVSFIGWTDVVLAEFPFLFFLMVTLWWLDRCGDRRSWEGGSAAPLIVLGILIGFTLNIRREGLALVLALVVAQLVYLRERRKAELPGSTPWRRFSIPYASLAGFVGFFQLLLPTVLFQRYPDTGLHNLAPNAEWFRDILAQHIGLTRPGWAQWEIFGSHLAALALFGLFLVAAVLGMVVRMVNHGRHDGVLIAYLVGATLIVGVQPFHEGRYLFAITPMLAYFAYQGIATTISDALPPTAGRKLRSASMVLAVAFMVTLTSGSVVYLYERTPARIEQRSEVIWGPDHPASREMFAAVRAHTRRDDILSFFRARAMNLFAERQTLQLTRLDQILDRADWYVMEKGSTYSQVLLSQEEAQAAGLTAVWENDRFVLWKVPDE